MIKENGFKILAIAILWFPFSAVLAMSFWIPPLIWVYLGIAHYTLSGNHKEKLKVNLIASVPIIVTITGFTVHWLNQEKKDPFILLPSLYFGAQLLIYVLAIIVIIFFKNLQANKSKQPDAQKARASV